MPRCQVAAVILPWGRLGGNARWITSWIHQGWSEGLAVGFSKGRG